MSFLIAPSLLASDFSKLSEEIQSVEKAGADWIHLDIMDGHFVPNITFGPSVIKSLRKTTSLPFDVHLMIENPEKFIDEFIQAGADYLTLHIETLKNPSETLQNIRKQGCRPGITLKPETHVDQILPFLPLVDLVLIMTVDPGFGGQKFMGDQLEKVKTVKEMAKELNHDLFIEVDGGINKDTAALCKDVDVLVAGSYIFSSPSYKEAIDNLKR